MTSLEHKLNEQMIYVKRVLSVCRTHGEMGALVTLTGVGVLVGEGIPLWVHATNIVEAALHGRFGSSVDMLERAIDMIEGTKVNS